MYDSLKFIRGGKFISRGSWRHPTRTINSTEIIIVTEGEVRIFVGERQYSAKPGEIIRILPGEPHGGTEDTENTSFFWFHFTDCEKDELPPEHSRPTNFDRIRLLSKELLHYQRYDRYPQECTAWMIKLLLSEIASGNRGSGDSRLTSEIKQWVSRAEGMPVRISELAAAFGYNEDYLNRAFKNRTGISIKQYIDGVRLDKIKADLLNGNEPLAVIAEKYGFGEYKYLLKFFKYHEGISPTRYKETYYDMHTNSK